MISDKKKIWIEVSLHLLFWVGIFYMLLSFNRSHIHMWAKTRHVVQDRYEDESIASYVYIILGFLVLLFYGNVLWVFRRIIRYKNGFVRLAICAGWFMLVFTANYVTVGPLFDRANKAMEPPPLPRMPPVGRMQTIQSDTMMRIHEPGRAVRDRIGVVNFTISDWLHMQVIMLLIFMAMLGLSIAYFFLKEWAKSELIHSQLRAYQLSTEIKFLKSQVNPHFLFNTLNNLFSMAQKKGADELADGISKLSGMMRYMIYESNEEMVPLKKEIEYLQNCIVLNKLRYADDEVKVVFNYPEKTEDIFIAPMLFISFVENAFKHGVSIGTSSQINISIILAEKQLHFSCENTNFSYIKKMAGEKSGIGLENVKRRLELAYPGKHRLVINDKDGEFMVKLEIELS